jgi:hypothetical protein
MTQIVDEAPAHAACIAALHREGMLDGKGGSICYPAAFNPPS